MTTQTYTQQFEALRERVRTILETRHESGRDCGGFYDRKIKNEIRKQLFHEAAKKKKTVRKALMMPSWQCLCVEEALNVGLFTTDTHIVAIEGNKKAATKMRHRLKELGFNNVEVIRKNIAKITQSDLGYEKFDFVYLDLCSTPSDTIERWMQSTLSHAVRWSTPVAMTFIYADRSNNCLHRDWEFRQSVNRASAEYKFSNNHSRNYCCNSIANMTLQTLLPAGKNRIVKYGRAYRNDSLAMPMVTFLTGYGLNQKWETHKRFPYDFGFKDGSRCLPLTGKRWSGMRFE